MIQTCDYCGLACGEDVVTLREGDSRKERSFCSMEHLKEFLGFEDRITLEADRRFRRECNLLYKEVCPACKRRLQKKFL
jgi:hypothetical protein